MKATHLLPESCILSSAEGGQDNMFQRLRFRKSPRSNIHRLYGAIVAQARKPLLYRDYGVPDTIEGRFDLIVLHIYLVSRRLMRVNEAAHNAVQDVFDLFFQDMDESMRELVIGDLSVPRKIHAMSEAFYGRAGAYDEALRTQDSARLSQAIYRNVFSGSKSTAISAEKLTEYSRSVESLLAVQEADFIVRGEPM